MTATVDQLIATINPNLYYQTSEDKLLAKKELKDFKELIKTAGFQKAAEKAKPKSDATHTIVYDSSSETLEPLYFFILDLMNDLKLKPEKLVDNFSSTPGSGHFAELGQRATVMQQQASKLMGDVNTVLRSVLNIIYDLKDFKMRLQHYAGLISKKKEEQDASMLALKQIWMDKVDIAKGNSSIKAMGLGQSGFQTLIDAFLSVKDEKDVDQIDLNDRVKRIIKPRILEFNIWLKESERELKKRYDLEKTYLRSQVNSLKLYSRWAKPYLKAAQDLEAKESGRNPGLVKTFNTIILELTLLGKSKLDIADEAMKGTLPKDFSKPSFLKKIRRNYHSVILVDFTFRGIPQRVSQQAQYVFGGLAEVTFKSYALNDDELKKFEEEFKKSEINDIFGLIEGTTTESLGQLQDEVNSFLEEKTEKEKETTDESNPFLALIGKYEKKGTGGSKPKAVAKKDEEKETIVTPDTWIEKTHFRPLTAELAKAKLFDIFDIYKKAHSMASYT
jgi:hypothetical protein